jgi:glycerol-3-phosphate O-acyltransferase
MVRHAVGYQSRAFVTFGRAIPLGGYDPESRREVVKLAQQVQREIGRLYKVLPTALICAAFVPRATRTDLAARIDQLLMVLAAQGANLGVRSGRQAVADGVDALIDRGVIVEQRQRLRVRDRFALRYYARTIQHLVTQPARATH